MSTFLSNWKTTLTAVLIVVLAVLHSFFAVNIPGFNMDIGSAITMALGLFVAGDATASKPAT